MDDNSPKRIELKRDYCLSALHLAQRFINEANVALRSGDLEKTANGLVHAGGFYADSREMLSNIAATTVPELALRKQLLQLRKQLLEIRKQVVNHSTSG
jgi:hypothetical protein